ncbi:MAG: dTDP-glucose 4,6-dehydratase [Acidimicrobiales bacterium]|nr:MAG: NAD(P)-dependent oxidoreductase [Actinomycetota bacterium]MBV6508204.1 dTDP-glucose 4,6-dehydratase [Acidimicrobiales bacterium]RIK07278.1 MAG: oxidoreductase [Acidobacteriota bacterium]
MTRSGTPRLLVTGAAGFIGRAVSQRFLDEGWEVTGVDLMDGADGDPAVPIVAGDVSEPGPWQDSVSGSDLVVHTAALVSNTATVDEAWAVNVRGTRNVIEAAVAAGTSRIVVFSSCAVYSHHREGGVTELTPVRPSGGAYGDTKIATEQVALQSHAAGEIDVTILRPGDVYGPGSRPWTIIPIQMLKAHQVVLPARGHGTFVPVYIDDLTDFVWRAATSEVARGQVFNVTGGVAVEAREFFAYYCRMLGIDGPRVAPTPVAVALAEVIGRVLRLLGRRSEANASTMRMLAATGSVSIARAGDLLGWEPQVDLDEGMQRTEKWLRANGLLP